MRWTIPREPGPSESNPSRVLTASRGSRVPRAIATVAASVQRPSKVLGILNGSQHCGGAATGPTHNVASLLPSNGLKAIGLGPPCRVP